MRQVDRDRLIREAVAFAILRLEEEERKLGFVGSSALLAAWRELKQELGAQR